MKIFFDTEFTGLHKDTTLISIGCVDEKGNTFYGVLNDYDVDQIDDWLMPNVIDNLYEEKPDCVGTKEEMRNTLLSWLEQYDTVEFVSDCCHYDFVLLIDLLWGHALNIPDKFSSVCHDINQDLATYFKISDTEAFNKSRKDIALYTMKPDIVYSGTSHNALYDAVIIKNIYKGFNYD